MAPRGGGKSHQRGRRREAGARGRMDGRRCSAREVAAAGAPGARTATLYAGGRRRRRAQGRVCYRFVSGAETGGLHLKRGVPLIACACHV